MERFLLTRLRAVHLQPFRHFATFPEHLPSESYLLTGALALPARQLIRKSRRRRAWLGWRRRLSAWASIWRTRSRVTPIFFPTCSSV